MHQTTATTRRILGLDEGFATRNATAVQLYSEDRTLIVIPSPCNINTSYIMSRRILGSGEGFATAVLRTLYLAILALATSCCKHSHQQKQPTAVRLSTAVSPQRSIKAYHGIRQSEGEAQKQAHTYSYSPTAHRQWDSGSQEGNIREVNPSLAQHRTSPTCSRRHARRQARRVPLQSPHPTPPS